MPATKVTSAEMNFPATTDANGWSVRWLGDKRIFTKRTVNNPNRGSATTAIDTTLSTSLPVGIANTGLVSVMMTPAVSGNAAGWNVKLEAAVNATTLNVVVRNESADWKDISCYWTLIEI